MGCMQQPATSTCTVSNPHHTRAMASYHWQHVLLAPLACHRRILNTTGSDMKTPQRRTWQHLTQLPHTFHTTRLSIQGSGFSRDLYQGSNQVYIGPYPCTILSYLTTDSVITCETIAGDEGTYTVTVVVDGAQSASQCCFSYNASSTPSK